MTDARSAPVDACYWLEPAPAAPRACLENEIVADVAIVGGGIVGVIAARLLADAGRSVVLLEAGRIGRGVTGRSTAKVTAQHALALHRIEERHGADTARLYAEANRAGVALIGELVGRHALACDFEPADSFVYATSPEGAKLLEAEQAAAARAGLAMEIVTDAGLPFPIAGALRLPSQAQFHPEAFVAALARTLPSPRCAVFKHSPVIAWEDDGVRTVHGRVRAPVTIMATHLPLGQVGQFHAHTHPHMHAIMAMPVAAERAPKGMHISADEPKRSIRSHRDAAGRTVLILTGPRFVHGDAEAERAGFAELADFAREHFGCTEPGWRWCNEDYTPRDGLPYVGWSGAANKSPLVATGFDAWGLSNGAAAARILADLAEGRANSWAECFDASRHSAKGLGTMLGDAGKTAAGLVRGHLASHADAALPGEPGDAALVEIDGRVAGVFRDDDDRLHAVSAVCTHMGCMLGWNPIDRTWDCRCHGSRFGIDGEVQHGPAIEPLAIIEPETRS